GREVGSPTLVIIVTLRPESRGDCRPREGSADFFQPAPPLARDRRRALPRARPRAAGASERLARARLHGGGRARHRAAHAVGGGAGALRRDERGGVVSRAARAAEAPLHLIA